jgi:hypothetical protein
MSLVMGRRVPLWGFLLRIGVRRSDIAARLGAQAAQEAELRCAVCGARRECLRRLRVHHGPVGHCPNAPLVARVPAR